MPCPEHSWQHSDWIQSAEGQEAVAHAQTEEAKQYFQDLTDLFAIWWTFLDLLKKNWEFVLPKEFESLANRRRQGFDVWAVFVLRTKFSFHATWKEIMEPDAYPPSSGRFLALTEHPYYVRLYDRTIKEAEHVSRRENIDIASSEVMTAGLNTGIEVGITGPARLLQAWHEATGLHLSKVDLAHIVNVQLDLGLRGVGRNEISDYSLTQSALYCPAYYIPGINTPPTGLNLPRLRDIGYGQVLGCPAGKAMSRQSRNFLQTLINEQFPGAEIQTELPLVGLSKELFQYFWHDFIPWYCSLSKQKRDEFFNADSRAMLDRAEEVYADP